MPNHRILPEAMTAYRIGDPQGQFPIWSSEGARRTEGRWHQKGSGVIYTSQYYSTALLEKLVRFSGELPKGQHFIEISIPAGLSYEVANVDALAGWASMDGQVARQFGVDWYDQGRSLVLIVPSVVARLDNNLIINAQHPEFDRVKAGLETPICWDNRLFQS